MTNAMRYGAGKPVHVSVVSCADGACIEVRDHGIGISPQSLERIFCQFVRAEGSESSAGLGLGLFIADQIVRAHNGRIQVQSEERSEERRVGKECVSKCRSRGAR